MQKNMLLIISFILLPDKTRFGLSISDKFMFSSFFFVRGHKTPPHAGQTKTGVFLYIVCCKVPFFRCGIFDTLPVWGSDRMCPVRIFVSAYFNPRSPCGERLEAEALLRGTTINAVLFQSTLPVRRATYHA